MVQPIFGIYSVSTLGNVECVQVCSSQQVEYAGVLLRVLIKFVMYKSYELPI